MNNVLTGPMFEPPNSEMGESLSGKTGMHYNIYRKISMATLKNIFPDGIADELNFVLFSTSGIHGNSFTIEEIEKSLDMPKDHDDNFGDAITVLIIHPRTVTMRYGNVTVTKEDLPFLKKLRETSHNAMLTIGN
jgi:hypothetical protein